MSHTVHSNIRLDLFSCDIETDCHPIRLQKLTFPVLSHILISWGNWPLSWKRQRHQIYSTRKPDESLLLSFKLTLFIGSKFPFECRLQMASSNALWRFQLPELLEGCFLVFCIFLPGLDRLTHPGRYDLLHSQNTLSNLTTKSQQSYKRRVVFTHF